MGCTPAGATLVRPRFESAYTAGWAGPQLVARGWVLPGDHHRRPQPRGRRRRVPFRSPASEALYRLGGPVELCPDQLAVDRQTAAGWTWPP